MMNASKHSAWVAGLWMMSIALCLGQEKCHLEITTNRPDGKYTCGEEIVFEIHLKNAPQTLPQVKIVWELSRDGVWREKKEEVLPPSSPLRVATRLDKPGCASIKAETIDGQPGLQERLKSELGAIAMPFEIHAAADTPADFEAFWAEQRKLLDAVPMRASRQQVPVPPEYQDKLVCYDIRVDCLGPQKVSGYLCMPLHAQPHSLPALVTFQGGGVYGAHKELKRGSQMIALNINAHGIENGKPRSYYVEDCKALSSYAGQGMGSRETYYYKGIYLRVMRALDYVKSLPEWDGRNLFVAGASQAGTQSLVATALDKQVTFCYAAVPALSDLSGNLADRKPGWPAIINTPASQLQGWQRAALDVLRYFDVANFAKLIHCECYFSVGLIDFTCPPTSVFAAYNNLPPTIAKNIQINQAGGHGGSQKDLEKRFDEVVELALQNK